jgi:hypothetical protein
MVTIAGNYFFSSERSRLEKKESRCMVVLIIDILGRTLVARGLDYPDFQEFLDLSKKKTLIKSFFFLTKKTL